MRFFYQTAAFAMPLFMLLGGAVAPVQRNAALAEENGKVFRFAESLDAAVAKSGVLLGESNIQTKQNSTSTATLLRSDEILEQGDDTFDDGAYFDAHYFTGRANQEVTIYLESDEFDTYLLVFGPDGSVVAESDDLDPNSGTNSGATISLPSNGDYAVVATSYSPGEIGRYVITVNTALGTGDIQATLSWDSQDDLDLFVMDPNEDVVTFSTPQVPSGGALDVDANALCRRPTDSPVENVYWPQGQAPGGEYRIGVSLYERCTSTSGPISFTLTLRVQGSVETFTGTVDEENDLVVFNTAVYR
ncbi:MAG: hypothetical protein AAGF66_16600 [Cyanobacteria bacterium P01_H01_bin.119]